MPIGFRDLPGNRFEIVGISGEALVEAAKNLAKRLKKMNKDIESVKIGTPKKIKGRGWVLVCTIITK